MTQEQRPDRGPWRLSVIIPAYNERDTILEAIRRVRAIETGDLRVEIVVVDDCSTDGTRELLEGVDGIRLLKHPVNRGKGAAIRTALDEATGDIIAIQDADLEYDPSDLPRLCEPIRRGEARVVYGSRFLGKTPSMGVPNYVCNRLLAIATNILYGARITDEATCYKLFDAALLRSLPLQCRRFEFCPEVTALVLRRGEQIVELPIEYDARSYDSGKKIKPWDAVEAFWTLLRGRFRR